MDIWVVARDGDRPGLEFIYDPKSLSKDDVERLVYCAESVPQAIGFIQGYLAGDKGCTEIWNDAMSGGEDWRMRGRNRVRSRMTGAIRFRRGFMGRPVVQVQVIEETVPWAPPPIGKDERVIKTRKVWRDASKSDMDSVFRCNKYIPTAID